MRKRILNGVLRQRCLSDTCTFNPTADCFLSKANSPWRSMEQKMKRTGKLRRPPQNTPALFGTQGQEISLEQRVRAHYFLPRAHCHWYVLEYSKDLDLIFGWIQFAGRIGSFGYCSLKELEKTVATFPVLMNGMTGFVESLVEYDRDLGSVTLGDCLRGEVKVEYGNGSPR
jgi:hypothetical protein